MSPHVSSMRPGAGVLVFAAVAFAGCAPPADIDVIACATRERSSVERAPTVTDPVDVLVRIDTLGPDPGRILVRVDPLEESGVVRFARTPPPTTAAVGLALTTAGVFQGCLGQAPSAFLLQAPRAPADRAWLRVSTDRTVRVRVERWNGAGWEGALSGTALVVVPGASGSMGWSGTGAP